MNFLFRSNSTSLCHQTHGVLRALCFSTGTIIGSDSLNRRITEVEDPTVPIVPVIEKWVQEGNDVTKKQLLNFIKMLRKYHRFGHALQISKWLSDKRRYILSPGDIAVQLDLISKVDGLEQAEKFFNSTPNNFRGYQVYGALLNCYAHHKCLEKAEPTMQKMREMGFVNVLSYNVMLNLYVQMGKRVKLETLMQEMEKRRIGTNNITYKILLNAYAATSDIEKIDNIIMKMEADPLLNIEWYAYVIAANGYFKAGLIDKTLTMLWRSQQLIGGKSAKFACQTLLPLYSAVGNVDEVYRVWNLYKHKAVSLNSSFLCMINSLMKLNHIDGAESILEEWLSNHKLFDIRIPNAMISGYSQRGFWEKSETLVTKIMVSGMEIKACTLDRLATSYHVGGQMTKALETIKKAISISKPGWKPNMYTLAACLEYSKAQGDVEATEELLKMLRERHHLSSVFYNRLKCSIVNKESLSARALKQMEVDDEAALNGEMPVVTECEDKDSSEL